MMPPSMTSVCPVQNSLSLLAIKPLRLSISMYRCWQSENNKDAKKGDDLSATRKTHPTTLPTSSGTLIRPEAVKSDEYFFTDSPLALPSIAPSFSSI